MKYAGLLLPLVLAGCANAKPDDAPKPPNIGMANPAAVYCQQKGGTSVPVQTPQGVRSDCKLPSGEVIDEWTLYRRDRSGS